MQWAALAVMAVLVLGLYRQLALFLGTDQTSLEQLSGPRLGRPAPAALSDALAAVVGNPLSRTVVCFVSEGCSGCHRLLAQLADPALVARLEQHGARVLIVALAPSEQFANALSELAVPHVADDGDVWRAVDVAATPFVVTLDSRGTVTGKAIEHDIERVVAEAA